MRFAWVVCAPDCAGWVAASGLITETTPKDFDEFARTRDLRGVTVVLDSGGGSVNDAITLGRRWRALEMRTTVGKRIAAVVPGEPDRLSTDAYCESMCVLLLLAGKERYVADEARVKVHQIWLGDRADNAKAHTYSANDLTVVQRDIGRLVKYTADMGGSGELIRLMLSIPPWEKLHRLDVQELRDGGIITVTHADAVVPGVTLAEPAVAEVRSIVLGDTQRLHDAQPGRVTGTGPEAAVSAALAR